MTTAARVFVYATLKQKGIQRQALGHQVKRPVRPAGLPGFVETHASYDNDTWPTLERAPFGSMVVGEILNVTDSDLTKLDRWESHYRRIEVLTTLGKAWAYVFKGSAH